MSSNPLLLLDNSAMMSVINRGVFKCTDVTFEEAKAILEMHDEDDVLQCFTNLDIQNIIFEYLGIRKRNYQYKHIRDMKVMQDGLVFKLYVTPSETQPVIVTDKGNEAKKIQNIYVYCQMISRIE
ncbi:MAG TPA: hypothetical protein H9679_03085 [Firmicutes bacterium]|nr:hypothetical protein [Bacillota bacterium]